MSRAGREPGYKKQNQDNCFAFEKYVAAGQSLFGAFDGHGPNGRPPALLLLWQGTGVSLPRNEDAMVFSADQAAGLRPGRM